MNILAENNKLISLNQEKGFAISILAHLLIIVVLVATTSRMQPAPKLMVVDFSLLENSVKDTTSQQSKKQKPTPTQPVIKVSKNATSTPTKPVPIKKLVKKPAKTVSVKKTKIAAIKQKAETSVKAEPKAELPTEPLFHPAPTAAPQVHEEKALLAQSPPAPPSSIEPILKSLPAFPAPAAGKARKKNDHTTVSKYTKAQFKRIRQSIQQQMSYPRVARRMGWEGKVVIEFIICTDGTVKDIHIVKSSGFNALDKNAVATIKKAAPFPIPPIPAKLIVPVVYKLG